MFLSRVIVEVLVEEFSKISDQIVLLSILFLVFLFVLAIAIRFVKKLFRKIFKGY